MSILNQQKIEKIFQSQEDISFKKYFETNLNTLPLRSILPKEKLTLDLIQQIDEKTFSKYYINLKNSGNSMINFIESELYKFTFELDEKIKFWIVFIYPTRDFIRFILWYCQYCQSKSPLLKVDFKLEDILLFNFNSIFLHYQFDDMEKIEFLFNPNNYKYGNSLL